jgi:hypothetical protein
MLGSSRTGKGREKETEGKIQELCDQFSEHQYLLTNPWFGPDVSAEVLEAIGDPYRFQNGKKVLKLGGLDLSADRSGRDWDYDRHSPERNVCSPGHP